MPYNEQIETRVQKIVSGWKKNKNTDRKKMFGGVCHLIEGHMFCGVYKDFLILRLGEQKAAEVLASDYVKPFDITGKPMKGWVMVERDGMDSDEKLAAWLDIAKNFALSLPPK